MRISFIFQLVDKMEGGAKALCMSAEAGVTGGMMT
jgi:hypothetical protein